MRCDNDATMRRSIAATGLTLIAALFAPAVAEEAPPRYVTPDPKTQMVYGADEVSALSSETRSGRRTHRDRPHTRRGHQGMDDRRSQHAERAGQGAPSRPKRPTAPNNALNLALVILIPAALGAIGGFALGARTLNTAS